MAMCFCHPILNFGVHRNAHQTVHWNLTGKISYHRNLPRMFSEASPKRFPIHRNPTKPFFLNLHAEFCQFFKHFGIFFFNKMLAGFLHIIPLRCQHRSLMTAYNQPEIHHRIAGLDFQSLIGCLPDIVLLFAFVKNVDHLFNNFQESAAVMSDDIIDCFVCAVYSYSLRST